MGTKTHLTNTEFSCVIFKTFDLIYLPDYKLNVWSLQKVYKIFIKMQRGKSPNTPKTHHPEAISLHIRFLWDFPS